MTQINFFLAVIATRFDDVLRLSGDWWTTPLFLNREKYHCHCQQPQYQIENPNVNINTNPDPQFTYCPTSTNSLSSNPTSLSVASNSIALKICLSLPSQFIPLFSNLSRNPHTTPAKDNREVKMPANTNSENNKTANPNTVENMPGNPNSPNSEQFQILSPSFMGLPAEIRQKIYGYALATPYNKPLIPDPRRCDNQRGILRANRDVYNEAVGVFYRENIFKFDIESYGSKLVDATYEPHLGKMRHIILCYAYHPRLGHRRIDKSIARFLQMVLDRCPALETLVLYLEPEWEAGYEAEFEAPSILRDERQLPKTHKAIGELLPKVRDYFAIVALVTDEYFAEADTSLPFAPEVKWGGKNLEPWFPAYGRGKCEYLDDEVLRLWLFSAKKWSTMRWLKNKMCDFQERPRVEEGESEMEEPDEYEESEGGSGGAENEEVDRMDVAEEERDEESDGDEVVAVNQDAEETDNGSHDKSMADDDEEESDGDSVIEVNKYGEEVDGGRSRW